ncbi:DNA polymerase III subunit gamma/tau [Shewanella psychropiezotolerans]|uniref:DNA-directed DNA polymerase n=1 Tax=Shewanella psychropiezotolerans TaxID=2593655 RepID=A0ABX5X4B2_9GAMM|nr:MULTISPECIES: DNA polymerase III subunit gamma/tau [Shewanella]MPY21640.1 DNA polymerase III subunit gamma/tau [Shewanella sp. YLB-07]QDO84763.1 DNA polymerase III subunit gamma/tau [Shewanella psychropiezotolerans]
MSYQVLARKWRPATFEQMVGQSHVLLALTNALTQQRLHHAYLFSGTRGVGKTSLARLFAKGLNCEQGITASPCGQCSSCVEIAEGRFVDLIEVDAASRTKVDDTRELLDNVQYRPSRGRFKVYLIDEVHMLSRSSFNALLKTLEEPPEHVKFLLATTDPQRLPVTVLSRCLQFNLKSLTQDEISSQLSHVLTLEQLTFDQAALTLLAKAANGSMRDALSLTDQAIAFGAGSVQLTQVQTMLGSIDEKHVLSLLNALVQGDIENLMRVIGQILSFGADPQEVLRSLLELLHQITLSQFAPAAAQLSIYSEQIKAFAQQLSPEQVQLYYQLLLTGRKDLPHAPDPKSGLEMALLRAVSFVPETPVTRWVVDKPAKVAIPEMVKTETGLVNPEQLEAKDQLVSHVSQENSNSQLAEVKKESVSEPVSKPKAAVTPQAEQDDETDDLLALNSEQALILSQASSQGMEQSSLNTADQSFEKAVELSAAPMNETSADVIESAPAATSKAVTSPASAEPDNQAETTCLDDGEAETLSPPEKDPSEVNSLSTNQSNLSQPQLSPEQLAQDAAFDAQYGFQQDEQEQGDYQAFDSLPAADYAQPQLDVGSEMIAQGTDSQAGTELEDDILDAVLAARDSLLTDLAKTPEESAGKKPEAQRKDFAPPKRKPQADNDDEAPSSLDGQAILEVKSELQSEAKPERRPQPVLATGIEDRPPWEEPVEAAATENVTSSGGNEQGTDTHPMVSTQVEAPVPVQEQVQSGIQAQSCDPLPPLGEAEVTGHEVDLKWYRLMSAIDVGGRVRQLAVNSVCHEFTEPLSLLLKPIQKHLAADIAIVQLEEALGKALGAESKVSISVGVDGDRETPLEVRQRFHREIQAQAHQGLLTDTNVQWLMSQMGAELENDSLSYAPELLSLKGNTIELIDKSNFKALPQS